MTRSQLLFARIIGMLEAFREMHRPYDAPGVNDIPTDRLPSTPATEPTEQAESPQVSKKLPLGPNRLNLLLIGLFSLFLQSCGLVTIGNEPSTGSIRLSQGRGRMIYLISTIGTAQAGVSAPALAIYEPLD